MSTRPSTAFTDEQLAVIHHDEGHALVAAVAGSGKTETLLGRVQELLRRKVPAQRILCLMYNRAARIAFAGRLQDALGEVALPEVHTFHGHARRIEQRLVQEGHLPAAQLAGQDDRRPTKLLQAALKKAIKECISEDAFATQRDMEDFQRFITLAKATLDSPQLVAEAMFQPQQRRVMLSAFDTYERERKRARWRSFDDLLYDTVPLLDADPALARRYGGEYDHVLVDELQDANPIQARLLKIRAAPQAYVMGVGDDDQCLYEFRGADPSIFTSEFEKDYPNTTRYTLSRTFRFGHALAMAAGQLITHNTARIPKIVVAAPNTPDTALHFHQSEFKAADLSGMRMAGRIKHWSEVLILVRYRAQTVPVELSLLGAGLPYEIENSSGLFSTRIIGGLIAILSMAGRRWPKAATRDEQDRMVWDLLKLPTLFLSTAQLAALTERLRGDLRQLPHILRTFAGQLERPEMRRALQDRADIFAMLADGEMEDASADETLRVYLQGTRTEEEIRRTAMSIESADEDIFWINVFRTYVRNGKGTVSEVLDALGVAREQADESERIRVTTIHGAKGLQSPVVILPAWVSGEFPRKETALSQANPAVESERRLAYVAATRAQSELHVYACSDPAFQQALDDQDIPGGQVRVSRFAYEMRAGAARAVNKALQSGDFTEVRPTDARHAQAYLSSLGKHVRIKSQPARHRTHQPPGPVTAAQLAIGDRVHHPSWGDGTVLELTSNDLVRVNFDASGERLVLLRTNKLVKA